MCSTVGGAQYRGGCSLPWGISWVPWGDILSTVGGWVPWGDIMSTVGGYLGCSVPWGDIMMHVGGYHEYRGGCSVPWGEKSFVICTPRYWTPPTVLMISPHKYHDIPPRYSNFKGWYPPTVLNTLHGTHDSPHVHHDIPPRYWTSPTVLKITPHGTHDIPPQYWTPPTVLKISPHIYHDIPPRYWTPPTVLKISPTVLMISPHGTEHPHGTAHTLYRVWISSNLPCRPGTTRLSPVQLRLH